jgi:hypothetical protein
VISLEPKPTLTINIELSPDEERALLERARMSGRDLAGYIHQILHEHIRTPAQDSGQDQAGNKAKFTLQDLIEYKASASSQKEADDSITLEEVRAGTSTIKDSMAHVVIQAERAERF